MLQRNGANWGLGRDGVGSLGLLFGSGQADDRLLKADQVKQESLGDRVFYFDLPHADLKARMMAFVEHSAIAPSGSLVAVVYGTRNLHPDGSGLTNTDLRLA